MKKILHKSNKVIIGIVAIAVSVGILVFFYQYSQRSEAGTVEIPVTFSKSEIVLNSASDDNITNDYVEINLLAGSNYLSGATVLMSYPKDIVTASIDNTYCKDLDSRVTGAVNPVDGTIAIVRVSVIDNDAELPTGLVCFARINFEPISVGVGTLEFIDGPVETRTWQIVGLDNTFTPIYQNKKVDITVNRDTGAISPTINPTETISPSLSPSASPSATLTPTPSPMLTATPSATLSPTITPSATPGTGTSNNITFNIRTQGVTKPPKQVKHIPVQITFLQNKTRVDTRTVTVSINADGTWTGNSVYDNLVAGASYTILIKGPKHLQKKICANNPSEQIGGQYTCTNGAIQIQSGDTTLDFTGITLLAGDIPLQNGIVDAVDITYIRSNMGKTDTDIVTRADLNYDGIVDSQDYGIIINALSFKYDEEE